MRTLLSITALMVVAVSLVAQEKPAAPPELPSGPTLADKDITPSMARTLSGEPERPVATIETTDGSFRCVLFPTEAPATVENFIGLSIGTKEWIDPTSQKKRRAPFYNGTIFHRVIPEFMIQGGDPLGDGNGGPGYTFTDEIDEDLTFDRPGRLAMANSGPATNGSQFFITEVPLPSLDGKHTIFGQCDNVELVQQIARAPRDPHDDKPVNAVSIVRITIEGAKVKSPAPNSGAAPNRTSSTPRS